MLVKELLLNNLEHLSLKLTEYIRSCSQSRATKELIITSYGSTYLTGDSNNLDDYIMAEIPDDIIDLLSLEMITPIVVRKIEQLYETQSCEFIEERQTSYIEELQRENITLRHKYNSEHKRVLELEKELKNKELEYRHKIIELSNRELRVQENRESANVAIDLIVSLAQTLKKLDSRYITDLFR